MSEGHVEVIRGFFEAFNRKDVEAQVELLSDDYEWRPAFTGGGLVEGSVYDGPERYRRYLDEQAETWADIQLEIDEMRDLGDSVLVLARIHAVGRASGVEVHQPFAGIWTFGEGGKLVKGRAYRSQEEALRTVDGLA